MDGRESNYIALYACIVTEQPPDTVLRRVFPGHARDTYKPPVILPAGTNEALASLAAGGMSYAEIGRLYGLSARAAYNRVYKTRRRERGARTQNNPA